MKNNFIPLKDVYCEAENQGIEVVPLKMQNITALCRPDGLVGIDYSKIECEDDEKAILLEEIGHFCTAAFYPVNAPNNVWEKQERKAARFVFEKYYPPEKLAQAMAEYGTDPWEISDTLGLPERFVREMLQFYTETQGVDFEALVQDTYTPTPEQRDESRDVAALLDELERTRGIHMCVTNRCTVADIWDALRIVEEYERKHG